MRATLKLIGQRVFSKSTRMMILKQTRWPRVGHVNLGQIGGLKPISRNWGGDRGLPIDRYYIEQFLEQQAFDIKGHVLEVGDNSYTLRFGRDQVTKSEVVHAAAGNEQADYVAEFAEAPQLPSNSFDCIICTQTLHLIADLNAGLATLYRILKPAGVLLVTVPGISKIYQDEIEDWGDYWRFTTHSARWVMEQHFPAAHVDVFAKGNVLAATAFLQGLATEDLTKQQLDHVDSEYQMSLFMRGQKPL